MQMKHVGLGNRIPGYNNEKLVPGYLLHFHSLKQRGRCTLVQSSLRSDGLGQKEQRCMF